MPAKTAIPSLRLAAVADDFGLSVLKLQLAASIPRPRLRVVNGDGSHCSTLNVGFPGGSGRVSP